MNKYESIKDSLKYIDTIHPNQYFDLNNRYSNDKIKDVCDKLNLEKLPDDYIWMLKEYGYLLLNGISIYGSENDSLNFEKLTLCALTDADYGDVNRLHNLKPGYIVLNHEELDDCLDLILDVATSDVYYWDYYNDLYELYDVSNGSSFINVLVEFIYAEYNSENILDKFPKSLYNSK